MPGEYFPAVKAYCTAKNLKYVDVPSEGPNQQIAMPMTGDHGTWNVLISVNNQRDTIKVFSIWKEKAPAHRLRQVNEFLCRANYGLIIGCFEFDFNDGEVRYRSCMDVQGADRFEGIMNTLMQRNLNTFDKYLPGIVKVANGNDNIEATIQEIENPNGAQQTRQGGPTGGGSGPTGQSSEAAQLEQMQRLLRQLVEEKERAAQQQTSKSCCTIL